MALRKGKEHTFGLIWIWTQYVKDQSLSPCSIAIDRECDFFILPRKYKNFIEFSSLQKFENNFLQKNSVKYTCYYAIFINNYLKGSCHSWPSR